jgi:hypothetical protein
VRELQIRTTSVNIVEVDGAVLEAIGKRGGNKQLCAAIASHDHELITVVEINDSFKSGRRDGEPIFGEFRVLHLEHLSPNIQQNTNFWFLLDQQLHEVFRGASFCATILSAFWLQEIAKDFGRGAELIQRVLLGDRRGEKILPIICA